MSLKVIARVSGHDRMLSLLSALTAEGIPRAGIHVIEPPETPEHGSDPISSFAFIGGLIGGAFGGTLGWLAMSWSPMPLIGAFWGFVVGALCGARWGAYAVGTSTTPAPGTSSTLIEIDSDERGEAERAQRICTSHQAWEVVVLEGKPDSTTDVERASPT